jgi:hypothetical protein
MSKIEEANCDKFTRMAAEFFYKRYCENSDNKNYRGEPCPSWEELPPAIRGHWCSVAMLASAAMTGTVKGHVDKIFSAMATRPQMYAATQESFSGQLMALTNVVIYMIRPPQGVNPTTELMFEIHGPGNVVNVDARIDDTWAQDAVRKTRAFIERYEARR